LLQWKSILTRILRVCVCGLSYPACYVHAPYCNQWPPLVVPYFSKLSHKMQDFWEKKYWTQNECFDFCLKHFSFLSRIQWDIITKAQRSSYEVAIFLWIFMKFKIFLADYWKILKYKILWKSLQWEPFCCMGQAGEYDEANRHFPQFWECTWKLIYQFYKLCPTHLFLKCYNI